jgi:hypothetical protein
MVIQETTAQDYAANLTSIRAILNEYSWCTVEEARSCLIDMGLRQRQLRTLKGAIQLSMQQIRSDYTAKRGKAPVNPIAAIVHVGEREKLRQEEARLLEPYERVARQVDETIRAIERVRLTIHHWIVANTPRKPWGVPMA